MGTKSWLRGVTLKSGKLACTAGQPRRSHLPTLEQLEDRMTPTVVFEPHFGSETLNLNDKGGATYETLSSPTVNIIFYGSNLGDVKQLTQDATAILTSTYFSFLNVYGSDGKANLGGVYVDSSFDDSTLLPTDSAAAHEKADFAEIGKAINSKKVASPPSTTDPLTAPIFVVVEDLNISNGSGGYNKAASYTPPGATAATTINFIAVKSPTRENFGRVFSHEMAERMSDPTGDNKGVTLTDPPNLPADVNGDNQIGDDEPDSDRYLYRLGGASGPFVQPYWYQTIGGMVPVVPDGNTEILALTPSWSVDAMGNDVFNYSYDLAITGDQNPFSPDDTVTIDSTAAGTSVVFDNQSFFFYAKDPNYANTLTSINIDLGAGTNTINLQGSSANVVITSKGHDTINIGKGGSLAGILGSVNVTSQSGNTTVNVDDSSDKRAHNGANAVTVSSSSITGLLATGAITYGPNDLSALNIKGGIGGNSFRVNSTIGHATTIYTGTGTNHVTVVGTNGGLTIADQGNDTVNVGDATDNLDAIVGPVTVQGNGRTALNLDDEANQPVSSVITPFGAAIQNSILPTFQVTDQAVTRTNHVIQTVVGTGVTLGNTLTATVNYNNVTALSARGGITQNLFTVLATSAGTPTTITAGPASDVVNVGDTAHNLDAIHTLTVHGRAGTSLNLDDEANLPVSSVLTPFGAAIQNSILPTFQVTDQAVTRTNHVIQTVVGTGVTLGNTLTATVNYSNVAALSVHGGITQNLFTVLATAAGTSTTLAAGPASDVVNVGDATHNLDAIHTLTIQGGPGTTLNVDDEANQPVNAVITPSGAVAIQNSILPTFQITDQYVKRSNQVIQTVVGTGQVLSNTLNATVNYSNVAALSVHGGITQNLFKVRATGAGTPTTIVDGPNSDVVNVGDATHNLDAIHTLAVQGGPGTTLNLDDEANQPVSSVITPFGAAIQNSILPTFQVTDQAVTRANHVIQTVVGTGVVLGNTLTATVTYSNVAALNIRGGITQNLFTVLATAASTPTTITAGPSSDVVNVGDATHNLDAIHTLTVHGRAGTALNLDDEANQPVSSVITPFGAAIQNSILPIFQVADQAVTRTNHVLQTVVGTGVALFNTLTATVSYSNVASLNIRGGITQNLFTVLATAAGTPTTIAAGPASDVVNVGDATHNLDAIRSLTVQGRAGTDLNVDDEANLLPGVVNTPSGPATQVSAPTFQITDQYVKRSNSVTQTLLSTGQVSSSTLNATLTYSNIAALSVRGGLSQNVFGIQATAAGTPTTVTAGPSNDVVNVGDATHNLDAINTLTVHGGTGTALGLDDEANRNRIIGGGSISEQTSPTFAITGQTVTRTNVVTDAGRFNGQLISTRTLVGTVNYDGIATLTLQGGRSGNRQYPECRDRGRPRGQ